MKKLSLALAALLVSALMLPVFAANSEGINVVNESDGKSWSGANIILGSSAAEWPFSDGSNEADENIPVAFTPEKNETYTLKFNVKSTGWCAGFRVRWQKDNSGGNYTSADAAVVNDHVRGADDVATVVPAFFRDTIAEGETKTYTVNFTMDGAQAADGLIGNLAIRGQQGANTMEFNWIAVYDKDEKLLAGWGDVPGEEQEPEESPSPSPEASPAPSPSPPPSSAKTGDNSVVAIAVAVLLLAGTATVLIVRKIKV
jgi:endo-1,4-beta-xylanase